MDIYGEYFGKPVEAVSDDELLEAIYSLEGAYQGGAIDEPEMYTTWYNEAHALSEEALKRGLGCQFEVFMDFDEEDPEEDIKPVVADYTSSELLETDGKRFMRRLSLYTYDGLNVQLGRRLYVHCEYDGGMGLTATLCDPALPTNYGKFSFRDFESFAEYLKLAEDYKELDDESLIDIAVDMDYYIREGVLIFAPDEHMDDLGSKFCLAEGFLNDRLD